MKQSEWNSLFETYPFFEAYRNYLQIDIMAADESDKRSWHGWVESRLRQLTLKVMFTQKTQVGAIVIDFTLYDDLHFSFLLFMFLILLRLNVIQLECFSAILFPMNMLILQSLSLTQLSSWDCYVNRGFRSVKDNNLIYEAQLKNLGIL